jgi:vacuolar-type H+-ATPase subunit E/Vma4
MLLKVLQKAIEANGLTMATERKKELLPGIVEVIDTGSTGRGTNEPGDGDFDFMLRIDREILKDSESFKEKIKEVLSSLKSPKEAVVTGNGDFRYKGVKIEGLDEPVDVDLTFVQRTDEIEFTTEECIKERLETIRRRNPEDYKYVIANILIAKKFLKHNLFAL